MSKNANYYDDVRDQLDAIADKLDPDNTTDKSANYNDAIVESLTRIAENFGGGLPAVTSSDNGKSLVVDAGEWAVGEALSEMPRVYQSSGYIYKTGSSTSASNRYTVAEFKKLLEDNVFAWSTQTIYIEGGEVPCFVLYYKYSDSSARAAILPYNSENVKYTTTGTYVTLSGSGYAKHGATPTVYAVPSGGGGGGSVLTISESSATTATEAAAAIENGDLIRFETYGVYYPCLYYTVNYDDTTHVELQCGPYNVNIYEDPDYNSFNNSGWPSNDGGGGEVVGD